MATSPRKKKIPGFENLISVKSQHQQQQQKQHQQKQQQQKQQQQKQQTKSGHPELQNLRITESPNDNYYRDDRNHIHHSSDNNKSDNNNNMDKSGQQFEEQVKRYQNGSGIIQHMAAMKQFESPTKPIPPPPTTPPPPSAKETTPPRAKSQRRNLTPHDYRQHQRSSSADALYSIAQNHLNDTDGESLYVNKEAMEQNTEQKQIDKQFQELQLLDKLSQASASRYKNTEAMSKAFIRAAEMEESKEKRRNSRSSPQRKKPQNQKAVTTTSDILLQPTTSNNKPKWQSVYENIQDADAGEIPQALPRSRSLRSSPQRDKERDREIEKLNSTSDVAFLTSRNDRILAMTSADNSTNTSADNSRQTSANNSRQTSANNSPNTSPNQTKRSAPRSSPIAIPKRPSAIAVNTEPCLGLTVPSLVDASPSLSPSIHPNLPPRVYNPTLASMSSTAEKLYEDPQDTIPRDDLVKDDLVKVQALQQYRKEMGIPARLAVVRVTEVKDIYDDPQDTTQLGIGNVDLGTSPMLEQNPTYGGIEDVKDMMDMMDDFVLVEKNAVYDDDGYNDTSSDPERINSNNLAQSNPNPTYGDPLVNDGVLVIDHHMTTTYDSTATTVHAPTIIAPPNAVYSKMNKTNNSDDNGNTTESDDSQQQGRPSASDTDHETMMQHRGDVKHRKIDMNTDPYSQIEDEEAIFFEPSKKVAPYDEIDEADVAASQYSGFGNAKDEDATASTMIVENQRVIALDLARAIVEILKDIHDKAFDPDFEEKLSAKIKMDWFELVPSDAHTLEQSSKYNKVARSLAETMIQNQLSRLLVRRSFSKWDAKKAKSAAKIMHVADFETNFNVLDIGRTVLQLPDLDRSTSVDLHGHWHADDNDVADGVFFGQDYDASDEPSYDEYPKQNETNNMKMVDAVKTRPKSVDSPLTKAKKEKQKKQKRFSWFGKKRPVASTGPLEEICFECNINAKWCKCTNNDELSCSVCCKEANMCPCLSLPSPHERDVRGWYEIAQFETKLFPTLLNNDDVALGTYVLRPSSVDGFVILHVKLAEKVASYQVQLLQPLSEGDGPLDMWVSLPATKLKFRTAFVMLNYLHGDNHKQQFKLVAPLSHNYAR